MIPNVSQVNHLLKGSSQGVPVFLSLFGLDMVWFGLQVNTKQTFHLKIHTIFIFFIFIWRRLGRAVKMSLFKLLWPLTFFWKINIFYKSQFFCYFSKEKLEQNGYVHVSPKAYNIEEKYTLQLNIVLCQKVKYHVRMWLQNKYIIELVHTFTKLGGLTSDWCLASC